MAGVHFYVKRDDLLHPHVSGNKWRKLLPQVAFHLRAGATGFATVGGRHSNHLTATAALCHELGVPCRGYVRGGVGSSLSDSCAFAKTCGMQLVDATRTQVRAWREEPPSSAGLNGLTWLPEGGTSRFGLLGLAECVREVRVQLGAEPTAFVVAAGSGGTAAGVARAAGCPVYAFNIVGDRGLPQRVAALLGDTSVAASRLNWHVASLGGFASGEAEIAQMLTDFEASTGVPLDPLYTAKALIGLKELLQDGWFARGSSIVFVHTGGLQGVRAWKRRYAYD